MEKSTEISGGRPPRVVLAVTGCVQSEITPKLASQLVAHPRLGRLDVIVVSTKQALLFFDPRDVEKIVGRQVFVEYTDHTPEFEVPHIGIAEWADAVFVYPASANTIAKCAHGMSDNLLTTMILAAKCPVFFGPTMNDAMYTNPAVQENLKTLRKIGYHILPQKQTRVKIRSSGKLVDKPFCSETMVLAACELLFGKNRSSKRASARA